VNKPISTATQTALNLLAPLTSPTFTGTISGITKTMVGLGNVDNTSDVNKPISTATQTALNLKAPLASPTFTGTATGVNLTLTGNLISPTITLNGVSLATIFNNLAVYFSDSTIFNGTVNVSSSPLGGLITTGLTDTGTASISGLLTASGGIATPTITLNGTNLATTLAQYQLMNKNLFSVNNTITASNPVIYIADNPTWYLLSGTYASNSQAITNAWGVVENNAQRLTLSAGTGSNRDMYFEIANNFSGQALIIKVWVLLGTATNFDLVVTNGLTWNSVGRQCFTSANGLNTSTYTQLTFSFVAPATSVIDIHVGATQESGITAQTAGTVYTYGWQICYENKTTNILGNLSVDTGITTNTLSATAAGTSITASADIKYNGTTSLTTQMATLNGYKTSGSIAATTTFQTIFTWAASTRGFITVIAVAPNYSMFAGFFEGTSNGSYNSLTQIAPSGNSNQALLNTTNVIINLEFSRMK
jgi:hypothetical protein